MEIFHLLGALFIFIPLTAFIIVFAISRRFIGKRALGLATDFTTLLLFVAVPVSVEALWGFSAGAWLLFGAIGLAIALLVMEKKRTKELQVGRYFKKTWRILFLVLSLAYAAVWSAGIIHKIVQFV